MSIYTSQKSGLFAESVIREMTRVFLARGDGPGVNLAQGFPDFAAPDEMKEAGCAAIRGNVNQYAITWGSKSLRSAISEKTHRFYGVRPDPDREVTVTCGATEAMMSAMLALVDPGDEVIVFEPFYENYGPDTILAGAVPRFVRLNSADWSFDPNQLASAFNNRTRAIIINTPNNPTGKVFSLQELEFIASLCLRWNVTAIMDEIYEHMVYDGKHHRMADIPGMAQQTVTISGASKTYSATGWRVGWLIAPPKATDAIRKVHDFLTVGAAAPLQEGVAHALGFPDAYYADLESKYRIKRDALLATLRSVGFRAQTPGGAYYILTDAAQLIDAAERMHDVSFSVPDRTRDSAFAHWMVNAIGVATVPGSSFYSNPSEGGGQIRFCYCKKPETLELAERLLLKLKG
jgi:aspartate/methionine/tyrosine aminotransferase